MKILTINAGSSSKKYKLFNDEDEIASIQLKNYEENSYSVDVKVSGKTETESLSKKDYEYSFDFVIEKLQEAEIIQNVEEIDRVVHRIVHGGEEFANATKLHYENIEKIKKYSEFAPLHNPVALEIVAQIEEAYPTLNQYGVFDTSFHLTNSKENYLYGLPYGYYENLKVRRYGFHGISYAYILSELKNLTKKDLNDKKIIIAHLGSGSSVCAIKEGKSFNHSFGFTPDENLIMATRSGEIDYDAMNFVKRKLNLSDEDVSKLINKESGLLGISGYTKDMKQLLADYSTNERAKLAVDMYVNKIVDYISQFFVQLQGCDYLVFTAGIGSGSDEIRKMVVNKLKVLNINFDEDKNKGKIDIEEALDISTTNSVTQVWAIPTNEELEMAREVVGGE